MKYKLILLFGFAILLTAATQFGRNSKIIYPQLGDPAGATQVNQQQSVVTDFSNDDNSRFRVGTAIADSTLTTFDVDFGVAFSELRVLVYTGTFPNLTRVTDPVGDGWVIAANGTNPKTQVDVTTPGSGGPHTFALLITQGRGAEKLNDLDDVDVESTAPEEGQSLVYSSGTFIPGASGDSSFKCQSISDPNLTLKNGFLILDSGVELQIATDLTVSLDTILGSNPANATSYYLYLDLDSIPTASLLSNGRQVRVVSSEGHFSLQTALPDSVLASRYVPLCLIKSATSGTVWSGTGSDFATLATRRHGRPVVNVSPTVYEVTKQVVGSIGSSGQIKAGHLLDVNSFPTFTTDLSFYGLTDLTDGSGNAISLTNNGTVPFTGTNILGTASVISTFNGTTQNFSSVATFFNPGNSNSIVMGGWFKATDWTPAGEQCLISQQRDVSDRGFYICIQTSGVVRFAGTNTAGATDYILDISNPGFVDGDWHHFIWRFDFPNALLKAYIDGLQVGSLSMANQRAITAPAMRIAAINGTASNFFAGSAEDLVFTTINLNDAQIRKLYSYRFDHNKNVTVENQNWYATFLDANENIVNEFNKDWVVSKTANSLYADLGLSSTDKAALKMQNQSFTTTVVPIRTYDSGKLSSAPSFPIAHGLGARPKDFYVLHEGASLSGEDDKRYDLCSVTDTNIDCDLSSLTIDGSHRIQIVASAAPIAVSVPVADATTVGTVSISTQTISGDKTLSGQTTLGENDSAFAGNIIYGVQDGTAPTAYSVGEFISANPGGNVGVGLSGEYKTVTSISLTAGDWDVQGFLSFASGTASGVSLLIGRISLTNDASDSNTLGGAFTISTPNLTVATQATTGGRRINISSTTTVYLVGRIDASSIGTANFLSSSRISARRIR